MRTLRVGRIALLLLVPPALAACASGRPAPGSTAAAQSEIARREAAADTTADAYGGRRSTRGRAAKVSRVTEDDIKRAGNVDLGAFLESRLAGVRTMMYRGELVVLINGTHSQGNPGALIIVDGSEGQLAGLSLQDITSIEVLKDDRAAIYGLRGGNGVLVITTKKR